jgi:hypothetical protein
VPWQDESCHVHPAWISQPTGSLLKKEQLCAVPAHPAQSASEQHSAPLLQTPPQHSPPVQLVMSGRFGLLHVPLDEHVSLVQGFESPQSPSSQHCLQPSVQQSGVVPPHVSVHVPHVQPLMHVCVPVQAVPGGVHDPVSPVKHWLEVLSVQVPQSPQLQSDSQVRLCVPQLPSPQSRDSVDPGFVHPHAVFSHGPHVQELPQSWPPSHEATSVQAPDAPMTHSKSSSARPSQSLSTASQSSVALVIVHSQPSTSSPLALP